ncbi:hypothetical protein JZO70_10765 [Enterococcus sp. 669A]|uniref:Uncharacterized protein n=1 Tax=Candidatus Enterococcus moelleringii TaxID=2815325 RepID=A0ABS3LD39_9ENTE|nr:hypothetical protein [Enterococcus sp. 669A]MBO1306646.1 hypothetical protein [Enterococcus sp. 669A]
MEKSNVLLVLRLVAIAALFYAAFTQKWILAIAAMVAIAALTKIYKEEG